MIRRGWILFVCILLGCALFGPAAGEDTATSATLRVVRFQAPGNLQLEVWLDGERLGFTPFSKELTPGDHYLTASAEALQPVMQDFAIGARANQVAIIPVLPLTTENHPEAVRRLIETIKTQPPNRHFRIMGLYLATDPDDVKTLLEIADKEMPGDAMVDLLRARVMLRGGDTNGALASTDRALPALAQVAFAWRMRAEALLAADRAGEAIDAANQAVILEPNGFRNLRVRARANEAVGKTAAARNDAERATSLYEELHRAAEGLKQ